MAVGAAAEIKSRLSIVDVVGETVALRKAGTTFKGLCPFHAERTPSFVVTPARGTYKCFGCGKGGDVFSFVMERDGVGFAEALRHLAARAGIELDERPSRDDGRRARLREVLETAIAFYHAILTGHRVGRPALDYLRRRGFTDATIERFQLGWAPSGWDTLRRELGRRRGITAEELAAAGLIVTREDGRRAYDRFRARIIFPIRDASGAPTGLGGRILEAEPEARPSAGRELGPKYLNSPATPLFDKSRTLYLIDRAKAAIRRSGQAVLVEGYTDALMAHQAGFENVVASLGTALTPGQVAILGRYARRVALAYDVDPAGQSAGAFGISELTALISEVQTSGADFGLTDVGVVRLPEGR
ncbi:MAG: DNA primase, partial [Chloroflexota bacterium]